MDSLAVNSDVFKNFDEPEVLASFEDSVRSNDAKNFALIFTDTDALGALDLNERSLTQLLDAKVYPSHLNNVAVTILLVVFLTLSSRTRSPERQHGCESKTALGRVNQPFAYCL